MLGYERVWLGRDLDDLVPLLSILTDQSDRDQLAAKAVELGIQEDTQGITRVRLNTGQTVRRSEQVLGQQQTGPRGSLGSIEGRHRGSSVMDQLPIGQKRVLLGSRERK
jgi:hypothetical protein